MALTFGKLIKPFFRLSADTFPELAAARYGRQADMDKTWQSFEPVARNLVEGFQMALDDCRFEVLVPRLNAVEPEMRGIVYEGAGMGLMLLDSLLPVKERLRSFVEGPGSSYISLVYIGAGLVLPRVPQRPERVMAKLDPLLRWFAMDGYGFYEGFFSWQRTVNQQIIPARLTGYARRVFDHGLGRSLWFATGANVERIASTIGAFPPRRQAELWSGIGLACAYAAGVVDRPTIEALRTAAGPYSPQLAVGATMAATFRERAGEPASHTELACQVLCGASSEETAKIAAAARRDLPFNLVEPAYQIWRQRLLARYTEAETREPELMEIAL